MRYIIIKSRFSIWVIYNSTTQLVDIFFQLPIENYLFIKNQPFRTIILHFGKHYVIHIYPHASISIYTIMLVYRLSILVQWYFTNHLHTIHTLPPQHTRSIEPLFVQYRTSALDGGRTLNQHRHNISCLLGFLALCITRHYIQLLKKMMITMRNLLTIQQKY